MCTARYVTRGVKEHNIARSGTARIGDVKWPSSITQATRGGCLGALCCWPFLGLIFAASHPRFRALTTLVSTLEGPPSLAQWRRARLWLLRRSPEALPAACS